jgi:hypothetical protein
MGFQRDQELRKRRRDRTPLLDDSGQLSIDFFIGLSIFLITLIIAATMISGLLVGLQSKTIDYDAVAYRTGVILVEDPGEPNTVFNYNTITEEDQWEFIGADQKDLVRRFGFTLYKSTPRVLSEEKINSFFFNKAGFTPSEYRERIIFGSYPYRFNITVKEIGGTTSYPPVGEPYEVDSSYGYIRRVVLVKTPSSAKVDMSNYIDNTAQGDGKFKVKLDYRELMNIDGAPSYIAPQYWIEPPKEDITITLKDVLDIKNQSQGSAPILNSIRIEYEGHLSDGTVVTGELPVDVPANFTYSDTTENGYLFKWLKDPVNDPHTDFSTVKTTFPAGYFLPSSSYANVAFTTMYVVYEFEPATVSLSPEIYSYKYGSSEFESYLKPAVLEVRVW